MSRRCFSSRWCNFKWHFHTPHVGIESNKRGSPAFFPITLHNIFECFPGWSLNGSDATHDPTFGTDLKKTQFDNEIQLNFLIYILARLMQWISHVPGLHNFQEALTAAAKTCETCFEKWWEMPLLSSNHCPGWTIYINPWLNQVVPGRWQVQNESLSRMTWPIFTTEYDAIWSAMIWHTPCCAMMRHERFTCFSSFWGTIQRTDQEQSLA